MKKFLAFADLYFVSQVSLGGTQGYPRRVSSKISSFCRDQQCQGVIHLSKALFNSIPILFSACRYRFLWSSDCRFSKVNFSKNRKTCHLDGQNGQKHPFFCSIAVKLGPVTAMIILYPTVQTAPQWLSVSHSYDHFSESPFASILSISVILESKQFLTKSESQESSRNYGQQNAIETRFAQFDR